VAFDDKGATAIPEPGQKAKEEPFTGWPDIVFPPRHTDQVKGSQEK
jgi:hypothetical protein